MTTCPTCIPLSPLYCLVTLSLVPLPLASSLSPLIYSYRSFWCQVIVSKIAEDPSEAWTPKDISQATAIKVEDVITALQHLGLLRYIKGQHVIHVTPKQIQQLMLSYSKTLARDLPLDPELIQWSPHAVPSTSRKRQRRGAGSTASSTNSSSSGSGSGSGSTAGGG